MNRHTYQLLSVDENYLQEHFSTFQNPQAYQPVSLEEVCTRFQAGLNIAYNYDNGTIYFKDHPQIALLPVIGPTSKLGGWISTGYMELSQSLARIQASGSYKAVMLYVDSPGGTVDGTEDWADDIRNSTLPTMAFIDGMGASAGYWQAISADKVIANSRNENFIGSVGVQTIHIDQSKVLKNTVGDVKIIRAEQSTLKNRPNFIEALTEEDEKKIVARLTAMADKFIGYVQERRPSIDSKSDALKGEVYSGPEALEIGLIDGLDSLSGALGQLSKIAGIGEKSNQNDKPKTEANMRFKAALTAILTALGFASVTSEEESPLVTEERLETLNASLETANARIQELEGNVTTMKGERDTAQASLATMTTERDEWKTKAEKYGKNAGADHTQPPKEKAEGGNGEGDGDAKEFLAYSHNVEALNEIKNFS